MNKPEWLQRIIEREEKATPGPWTKAQHDKLEECFGVHATNLREEDTDGCRDMPFVVYTEGEVNSVNAEFITNARTDIPSLLSALNKAMEALERRTDGPCGCCLVVFNCAVDTLSAINNPQEGE